MSRVRTYNLTLSVLFLLLSVSMLASAEQPDAPGGDKDQLAREIRIAVEQLEGIRAEQVKLLDSHNARLAVLNTQIDKLERQKALLDVEIVELSESLAANQEEVLKTGMRRDSIRNNLSGCAKSALPILKNMIGTIGQGIPFEKIRRIKQLSRIKDSMESEDAFRVMGSFEELWLFAEHEIQLSRSIDLWNEPVLLEDGKRLRQAWQIRIGTVCQFFVSEDYREVGVAPMNGETAWLLNPQEGVDGLKFTLNMMQKQRYPEMCPVYVVVQEKQNAGDKNKTRGAE